MNVRYLVNYRAYNVMTWTSGLLLYLRYH